MCLIFAVECFRRFLWLHSLHVPIIISIITTFQRPLSDSQVCKYASPIDHSALLVGILWFQLCGRSLAGAECGHPHLTAFKRSPGTCLHFLT